MTTQSLDLKFSNRELALIQRAASRAKTDLKTFIRNVANAELKSYGDPIHHIIYEAVDVAVKQLPQ